MVRRLEYRRGGEKTPMTKRWVRFYEKTIAGKRLDRTSAELDELESEKFERKSVEKQLKQSHMKHRKIRGFIEPFQCVQYGLHQLWRVLEVCNRFCKHFAIKLPRIKVKC